VKCLKKCSCECISYQNVKEIVTRRLSTDALAPDQGCYKPLHELKGIKMTDEYWCDDMAVTER
jgi:hypothetical protein